MSFSQFLIILRARWRAALAVFLATVGLGTGFALLLPKQYTASAAVLVDAKPDPLTIAGVQSPATVISMATQVDIIKSDHVAQRVVREMKLDSNPMLRQEWQSSTGGTGDYSAWAGELVARKLDVAPGRDSNVLTVMYSAADPKFATVMANAFVNAYIETALDLRVAPAKQYAKFFDERIKALRGNLEAAQEKLSAYQKKNGLLATDERLDIENQRLSELSNQLVTLQAISAESSTRNAQANSSGAQLQEVLSNPVVASLSAEIAREEAKLHELSSRLGDNHPEVVQQKASIAQLQRRQDSESRRVRASMGVNARVNVARESELRASLEAQRAKVLRMRGQRDEATLLVREVESAQRAYEAVSARYTQSSLESQSNQTNIMLLTAATEPSSPSGPKVLLISLVSVIAGLFLAVGWALTREIFDRRIRSTDDLTSLMGVPVLGVLPTPSAGLLSGDQGRLMAPGKSSARLPNPSR